MLRDEDFCLWRARVPRVKHIGTCPGGRWWTAPRRCLLDISFYDSLELHGVIPIDLISYAGKDRTDSVTFRRVISPHVVELAFSSYPPSGPSYFSSQGLKFTLPHTLRALRFEGILRFDLSLFHDALLTLPCLEVLRCLNTFPVSDAVLRHLLSSAILQELELGNPPQDFRRCQPAQTLLRLQHLGLRADRLEESLAVLTLLDTSRLESIKIHHDYDRRPLATRDDPHLFESLLSCCSTLLLKKIELIGTADGYPPQAFNINVKNAEPLLKFRNLEELIITSQGGLTFNNDLLELFSRSWLGMQHLELNLIHSYWKNVIQYHITLDGLRFLAQSWPNLEYLDICLTAKGCSGNSIENLPLDHGQQSRCMKLRSLGISCDSRVEAEPIVVATFLHNIFPNLSTIRALENANLPDKWREVQEILKNLVSRRDCTL